MHLYFENDCKIIIRSLTYIVSHVGKMVRSQFVGEAFPGVDVLKLFFVIPVAIAK
jgi:hypothetical protein